MSDDVPKERYWQNWDRGDAAKKIDAYWLAEEGSYRRALVGHIGSHFGSRVPLLEVGCGTGLIYGEMLRQGVVSESSYCGGDVSAKMLEIARGRFPRAQFRELDIFSLPFENNSQPNVICIHVLQHLPSYDRALRELLRVTGERLYIASWFTGGNQDDTLFSEPSSRWDGQSFHNNYYALKKFVIDLVQMADRDIAGLHVQHVEGANYIIRVSFGRARETVLRQPLSVRIRSAVAAMLGRKRLIPPDDRRKPG